MARVILSEQTADRIRQLIERQYKPGDRIPAEMELAEFLGVSRTTIREAVKILCSRNILEIRRGHGTFVCENPGLPADPFGSKDMDEEQLKADIFEMSLLLSIVRMKEIHREMEDRLKRYAEGEYIPMKEFRKLDIAFHKAVIEGCENQIISRSLPMVLATCTEWYSVWTSLDFGKVLESFRRYHRKILEAVESHDADSAYRYAAEHTQEIIDIYESSGKKSRKSE